ncbi:hypothetical protein F5Y16DRAFT_317798 [Xylariaceae sp. FL0255]|nr:hypothetical protein F5Y16DRAFT_317798 [Xylariaceae sp. FL0255]
MCGTSTAYLASSRRHGWPIPLLHCILVGHSTISNPVVAFNKKLPCMCTRVPSYHLIGDEFLCWLSLYVCVLCVLLKVHIVVVLSGSLNSNVPAIGRYAKVPHSCSRCIVLSIVQAAAGWFSSSRPSFIGHL